MLKIGDMVKVVYGSYPNRVGYVGKICELEAGLEIYVPEPIQSKWDSPTLAEVESIITNMPGGLDGFLKGWGWMQFAREVEKLCQEKNS